MTGFLIGLVAALLVLVGLLLVTPRGWKTRIYGVLVTIAGMLEGVRAVLQESSLTWLTPELAGGLMLGIGVSIVVLRQITTTPPGAKD